MKKVCLLTLAIVIAVYAFNWSLRENAKAEYYAALDAVSTRYVQGEDFYHKPYPLDSSRLETANLWRKLYKLHGFKDATRTKYESRLKDLHERYSWLFKS